MAYANLVTILSPRGEKLQFVFKNIKNTIA